MPTTECRPGLISQVPSSSLAHSPYPITLASQRTSFGELAAAHQVQARHGSPAAVHRPPGAALRGNGMAVADTSRPLGYLAAAKLGCGQLLVLDAVSLLRARVACLAVHAAVHVLRGGGGRGQCSGARCSSGETAAGAVANCSRCSNRCSSSSSSSSSSRRLPLLRHKLWRR
jgi:hypothetical protein